MMFECGDPGFSALRAAYFLLLRQKKVSKEKASRIRRPYAALRARCAAQPKRGARKLGFASNTRAPNPLGLALLASS